MDVYGEKIYMTDIDRIVVIDKNRGNQLWSFYLVR